MLVPVDPSAFRWSGSFDRQHFSSYSQFLPGRTVHFKRSHQPGSFNGLTVSMPLAAFSHTFYCASRSRRVFFFHAVSRYLKQSASTAYLIWRNCAYRGFLLPGCDPHALLPTSTSGPMFAASETIWLILCIQNLNTTFTTINLSFPLVESSISWRQVIIVAFVQFS